MKLTNIIALGVLGYSTEDVKSIQSAGVGEDDIVALAKSGKSAADIQEYIKLAGEDDSHEGDKNNHEGDENNHGDDEELKKLKAENEKLAADLKAAQQANTRQNIKSGNEKTDEERLNDWARSFM